MTTQPTGLTLIDGGILLIFVICAIIKGSKGFYKSLAPLLVTVAALAGALVLTRALLDSAMTLAYPWARERLLSRIDLSGIRIPTLGDISSQLDKLLPETVSHLLRRLDMSVTPFVNQAMHSAGIESSAQSIAEDAVSSLMLPLTRAVLRVLLFVVSFLVLKLVLSGLKNLLGIGFRLPVIRLVDSLGGAVIGILWCAAVMYLLFWVVELVFPEFFSRLAENSRILTWAFPKI